MSSNGKQVREPWSYAASKRAALVRIARQVAHDQQVRTPPAISLPRLRCLDEDCDTAHGANASRPR